MLSYRSPQKIFSKEKTNSDAAEGVNLREQKKKRVKRQNTKMIYAVLVSDGDRKREGEGCHTCTEQRRWAEAAADSFGANLLRLTRTRQKRSHGDSLAQ